MAKKKTHNISDLIGDLRKDIQSTNSQREIPDIITFCEDSEWLGLPHHPTNPINLYPVQKLVLKAFYRGSIGNENLELTEEEIELLKELGLDNDDRGNILDKYYTDTIFKELVLVWGRRAGKDFVSSIFALYEAMKLLECEGGDPYALYELSSANTINILTIANSKSQSRLAFEEIKSKLLYSKYFQDKFDKDGFTSESIYLKTPKDKEDNKVLKEKGLSTKKGSVGIIVGHSNSDSLLGMGCMVLILDEVASYKTTGGASSGDRIYTALTPTVSTYCRKEYKKDSKGDVIVNEFGQKVINKRHYDGKIISISSPRAKEGKFYELYKSAPQVSDRLVCRLPTWCVNPTHTRDSLRQSQKTMSEAEFNMEFGAEFSGLSMEQFFVEDDVKKCFTGHSYELRERGEPGRIYFVHIDPATSSHNYAVVVLHAEYKIDPSTKKMISYIVVDHIKYWHPVKGKPISIKDVDKYVVSLKTRFHIGLLTYDAWNAQESIQKLRKAGIPHKMTRFTSRYKNIIYKELENLITENRILIPYHELLKDEMVSLQRKFTSTGFKVFPKKDGDGTKTDDIVDCVAGASYNAIQKRASQLPSSQTVDIGISPSSNSREWRTMQGASQYGSGHQISRMNNTQYPWANNI